MIWGIIQNLALGEQLVAAAILFAAAWYLLRGLSLASTVGVAVTSGVMYVVVTAVALGIALALGWLDPRPGVIQSTIDAVQTALEDFVLDVITDTIDGVMAA